MHDHIAIFGGLFKGTVSRSTWAPNPGGGSLCRLRVRPAAVGFSPPTNGVRLHLGTTICPDRFREVLQRPDLFS